jgi:hypothetical protein
MALDQKIQIFPGSWCSLQEATIPMPERVSGAAAFCLRFTRACSAGQMATRYFLSITRNLLTGKQARLGGCHQRHQPLTYDEFHDPEILTRISQYELAFKMQATVPDSDEYCR